MTPENDDFSDLVFKKEEWWRKPIYWAGIILSIIWLVIALDYFRSVGWWTYRYRFTPAELVGTILSQLLPWAFIWFIIIGIERRNQLKQETRVLRTYMNQLMYPTEEGAVYTKTLTDALRKQIQDFKTVFAEVAVQTNNVKKDLKLWIDDLAGVVNHADNHTVGATKELARHITVLAKSIEKTNETTRQITDHLKERAFVLENTSEKVRGFIIELAGVLKENKENIETITTSLTDATGKTQNALSSAGKIAQSLSQNSGKIEKLFTQYDDETQKSNALMVKNAEKILTALKKQGIKLEEDVEKIMFKVSQAEEKASEQVQGLIALSDGATQHLRELGGEFAGQAELLTQTMQEAETRMQEIKEAAIGPQLKEMMDVSKQAKEYVLEATKEISDRQTDTFMKDARAILEMLSPLSVDIAKIFTPKAEEDLWKKYHAGDTNAFTRYLLGAIPKEKKSKIKEMFEKDPAFREAVTRYMGAFDELVAKAETNSSKDVLLPVLIGSDAGRLHMILKQSIAPKKKGD